MIVRVLVLWIVMGGFWTSLCWLGFSVQRGKEPLGIVQKLHLLAIFLFWPVAMISALAMMTGHPRTSYWIEHLTYGWLIGLVCNWLALRYLRKLLAAPVPTSPHASSDSREGLTPP